jgi:hypothetical protein
MEDKLKSYLTLCIAISLILVPSVWSHTSTGFTYSPSNKTAVTASAEQYEQMNVGMIYELNEELQQGKRTT